MKRIAMLEQNQPETWLVAPEYDVGAFQQLKAALEALGYAIEPGLSGVTGSQELNTWRAHSRRGTLSIEAETYIGLSVHGSPELLADLRQRWAASRPS